MGRLLAAEVISTTGSALTMVALPWFVLTTTGSATRSGLVMAAEVAPVAIFGFVSGGWAHTVGARRWMLLSDSLRAPLIALVPLLYALGVLPFWLLLAIVFTLGVFATPYTASQQILLAQVVGDDEANLARATSSLQGATRLTLLLGPPAAGALIAAIGAPAVLLLDAATYLAVIPLIYRTSAPDRDQAQASTPGVLAGLTTVYADRLLGTWTTASIFSEAAYQAVFVAFPVLTLQRYHATATLAGMLLAAFGAGAVTGSILASRTGQHLPIIGLALVGKAGQALTFLALIPAWPAVGLVLVSVSLGVFNGLTNGPIGAIRLRRIPPVARAKALTAITTITWLGGISGLVGAGPALTAASPTALFAALAALQAISLTLFVIGAATQHEMLRATRP
jgi:predicted MFS family arabinose efflux permease